MDLVKCMDTDDILEVWNYVECDNKSPMEIKSQRGIIKNKEGEVIATSFGYTDEYSHVEEDDIQSRVGTLADWTFHYSMEGTLLRLFHYQSQWYLATHKKLDAFKSRWSCKQTFGELFVDALEDIFQKKSAFEWLQEQLPRENVYFFLMRSNTQNRIVCHANQLEKKNAIILLGHYTQGEHSFQFYEKGQSSIEVLHPFDSSSVVPTVFDNVHSMTEFVSSLDPFEYQGVIGFKTGTYETVKIVHQEYQRYANIRGNNPNLRFRYLEIRNDPEQLKLLYVLYPKYTILFDEYESTLYEIARMIYHFYINRYIKNQYVTLPREEYLLLKKCHQWYLQDRKNNRIFTQKVLEILGSEPPLHLYKMIRRFHLEQGDMRYRQPMSHTTKRMEIPVYNRHKNRTFLSSTLSSSPLS